MRVLHIGKYFFPYRGGMESHLLQLCPGLAQNVEVEVIVFTEGRPEVTEEFGFRLRRVPRLAVLAGAPVSFELISHIASTPADIVHVHHPNPMALLAFLMSGHKGRLVITYHSDVVRQKVLDKLILPLHEAAWRRTSQFTVSSPNYAASSRVLSRFSSRTTVIPHGIELRNLPRASHRDVQAIKQRYPGGIVLAVGRLVGYKGFEYLIEGFSSRINRDTQRAHLLIIGDGPLRSSLEKKISDLDLSANIHLLMGVDDLTPYFSAADVFALPSTDRNEAYGYVQVEAMAYGLPIVNTTLTSGVPYVSPDGLTGISVPPRDSDALGEAISLLLKDDELRHRYSIAAMQRSRSEFSAEVMVQRTLEMYERVLDQQVLS